VASSIGDMKFNKRDLLNLKKIFNAKISERENELVFNLYRTKTKITGVSPKFLCHFFER